MVVVKEQQASSGERGPEAVPQVPERELSPLRVALLLVVIAGIAFGVWRQLGDGGGSAAAARSDASPVYAPYVDATLTPTYPFQMPSANPVSGVYLGFVVSDPAHPCAPSWGGYYSLEGAEQALDLDARAAQLRAQGGSAMVSFGGRDNDELAVACGDPAKLAAAYLEPVQRYRASAIDLDLEGGNLAAAAANARRAVAIATVQRRLAADGQRLRVWVTLPVSPDGLTGEGIAATRALLDAGVELAGVNAMAMDFGPGSGAGHDMLGTVEQALEATQGQVQALWRAAGLPSSADDAWGHVGATVMLGVNDVPGERFSVDDAHELAGFVRAHGIPRLSAWSLNRDAPCGGAFPKLGVLSNSCSGVAQKPLEFTRVFGRLPGTKTAHRHAVAATTQQRRRASVADDPAHSPYPIWRSTAAYVTGYKVVWQGAIYQANWWNQGTPPGSAAAEAPNGPWQLVGPVPAGSRAPQPIRLVHGHFPAWSPTAVYREGDRVRFEGMPYRARWYTSGQQPQAELPDDPSSPWEPLFTYPGEPRGSHQGGPR